MEEQALVVAARAARKVGALLRGARGAEKHPRAKQGPNDPVTVFDRLAERILVDSIKAAFPADGIVSEEGASRKSTSGYRWILDPIDGTNNFLRGYPHFCTSLGLVRGEEPRAACIYDPLRDELFTARAGCGAFLNGTPITANRQASLDGALIGVGLSTTPQRALRSHDAGRHLIPRVRGLRTSGSACLDLAYVACGRLDGTWFLSLSPWDVAAGILLVQEAGGRVSALEGRPLTDPRSGVLATNGLLHDDLIAVLHDVLHEASPRDG